MNRSQLEKRSQLIHENKLKKIEKPKRNFKVLVKSFNEKLSTFFTRMTYGSKVCGKERHLRYGDAISGLKK